MSIRFDSSRNKHMVSVTVQRKRWRGEFGSKNEATRAEAQVRDCLINDKPIPGDQGAPKIERGTMGYLADRVFEKRWKGSKSESSALINIKETLNFFGRNRVAEDIGTEEVDDFVDMLAAKGNGNGTINRKLSALSTVLTFALERGYITSKPKIERKKEAQGRIRWLTKDEEAAVVDIMNRLGKVGLAQLIIFLADTGLRPKEATSLRWRDIDFENKLVHVWDSKTKRSTRTIPMTRRVVKALKFQEGRGKDIPFPIKKSAIRRQWDKAKHIMDLDDDTEFVPYALRHTCATRLLQKGATLPTIQEWLGHSNILTTMRYAHLMPSALNVAVHLLEDPGPDDGGMAP